MLHEILVTGLGRKGLEVVLKLLRLEKLEGERWAAHALRCARSGEER